MNPFAGPRPLSNADPIFGRDRELRELEYLLTSQRIVVLHSPSGAGKSSLLNAKDALLDHMREKLTVWPVARVKTQPPEPVANRWVWSAITDFAGGKPGHGFGEMTLAQYTLPRLAEPTLLVFDQFEEVLRVDPIGAKNIEIKREFFRQLGELLLDKRIWCLIVLRDDYLAPLAPYRRLVPTHLQNRYRIDLLDREAASSAIQGTAVKGGRRFTADALTTLVTNLAMVKVEGSETEELGDYIEPLQLQVVCRDLWGDGTGDITLEQVQSGGSIDKALANYYATAVIDAAKHNERDEYRIRQWVATKLITPLKTRDQVRRETPITAGLETTLVDSLVDTHLIRQEERLGGKWLELAHDRLIEPVRKSNSEWFESKLSEWEKRARSWQQEQDERLRKTYLVAGPDLSLAKRWADENPQSRVDLSGYLAACKEYQGELDRKRREVRRLRIALAVSLAMLIAAGMATFYAFQESGKAIIAAMVSGVNEFIATQQKDEADKQSGRALRAQIRAEGATAEADRSAKEAMTSAEAARLANLDSEARLLLGVSEANSGEIAKRALWATASAGVKTTPEAMAVLQTADSELPLLKYLARDKFVTQPPALMEDPATNRVWLLTPRYSAVYFRELLRGGQLGAEVGRVALRQAIKGISVSGLYALVFGESELAVINPDGSADRFSLPTTVRSVLGREYDAPSVPRHAEISSDGKWLACVDETLRVWIFHKQAEHDWGKPVESAGLPGLAHQVAFGAGYLAGGQREGNLYASARLDDIASAQRPPFFGKLDDLDGLPPGTDTEEWVTALAIRDGQVAAGGSLGTLTWSLLTGPPLKGYGPQPRASTRVSARIERIVLPARGEDIVLQLREVRDQSSRVIDLSGSRDAVVPGADAYVAPSGNLVASRLDSDTVAVFDVRRPKPAQLPLGCLISPAGDAALCGTSMFSPESGDFLKKVDGFFGENPTGVSLNYDGHLLIVNRYDHAVVADWKTGERRTLGREYPFEYSKTLLMNASGTVVLGTDRSGRPLAINLSSGRVVFRSSRDDEYGLPALDAEGRQIAFSKDTGTVVLSIDRSRRAFNPHIQGTPVFSPDGKYVAVTSPEGVSLLRSNDLEPEIGKFRISTPGAEQKGSPAFLNGRLVVQGWSANQHVSWLFRSAPLDTKSLIGEVCQKLDYRNINETEWAASVKLPYRKVCSNPQASKK